MSHNYFCSSLLNLRLVSQFVCLGFPFFVVAMNFILPTEDPDWMKEEEEEYASIPIVEDEETEAYEEFSEEEEEEEEGEEGEEGEDDETEEDGVMIEVFDYGIFYVDMALDDLDDELDF